MPQINKKTEYVWRKKIDAGIYWIQYGLFRKYIKGVIRHSFFYLSLMFAVLILTIGYFVSDRLNFSFFPTPPGKVIYLSVQFHGGISETDMKQYMLNAERLIRQTSSVQNTVVHLYSKSPVITGDLVRFKGFNPSMAYMSIELTSPQKRSQTNQELIKYWTKQMAQNETIMNFSFGILKEGPPGRDIQLTLVADDYTQLKKASLGVQKILSEYSGVFGIRDNLEEGPMELAVKPNISAWKSGLTKMDLASQLHSALAGKHLFTIPQMDHDIDVRLRLQHSEKKNLSDLELFPILVGNELVSLGQTIERDGARQFLKLPHYHGKRSVIVSAMVNQKHNNVGRLMKVIIPRVQSEVLKDSNIKLSLDNQSRYENQSIPELVNGMVLGLILVYMVLVWVLKSYMSPFFVMSAIPFGVIGSIWGHVFWWVDLTFLSLFGIFGLCGIVVNNSIILIMRYKELLEKNPPQDALELATCSRLRPMILTTVTTVLGLTPLLFERSIQAGFLKPMAISLVFGLLASAVMVVVFLPALIHFFQKSHQTQVAASGSVRR